MSTRKSLAVILPRATIKNRFCPLFIEFSINFSPITEFRTQIKPAVKKLIKSIPVSF
ncbi:MAG: hypothetical protein AB2L26_08670 [Ignavibacteria bacterium]